MIRHPLLRCGLFIVFYVLGLMLFSSWARSLYSALIVNQIAIFGATIVMLAMERRGFAFVGLSLASGWWREALAGLGLGVATISATIGVILATTHAEGWHWAGHEWHPLQWLAICGLVLLAAAGEELLFRGYGFQRLLETFGPLLSLALVSFVFGALHGRNPHASWISMANTILSGLLFGAAYLRTRRLWLPIGWHWGWNLWQATLGFPVSGITFPQGTMPFAWDGGGYGPEAGLPATVVLILALVLVVRWRQSGSHAWQLQS